MAESVYKVIELVGTSPVSWEKAAAAAVKLAAGSLKELRVAEVSELDVHIVEGKIVSYRAKVKVSFKYMTGSDAEPAPAAAPAKKAAKRGRRGKG